MRRRLRRRKAKIPEQVVFQTKPQLAGALVEQAAGWQFPRAPILADCAYGDDTALPHQLARARARVRGRGLRADQRLRARDELRGARAARGDRAAAGRSPDPTASPSRCARSRSGCPQTAWKTLPCRTTPAGEEVASRFAFVRVVATHPVRNDHQPPREEWLIIEWPAGRGGAERLLALQPAAEDRPRERLARLARLRWTIELDYRQLKGELGLDHYEGRSYPGFHHHCALVTCAHAFLTLERLDPKAPRPA